MNHRLIKLITILGITIYFCISCASNDMRDFERAPHDWPENSTSDDSEEHKDQNKKKKKNNNDDMEKMN